MTGVTCKRAHVWLNKSIYQSIYFSWGKPFWKRLRNVVVWKACAMNDMYNSHVYNTNKGASYLSVREFALESLPVMGSNPFQAWIFPGTICNCLVPFKCKVLILFYRYYCRIDSTAALMLHPFHKHKTFHRLFVFSNLILIDYNKVTISRKNQGAIAEYPASLATPS